MNQERIGKFIAQLRKEKKMTQQELANLLGVTDRAISKWENGRGMPDISLLEPLAKILGININELIRGERIKKEKTEKFDENIKMTLQEIEARDKKIRILYTILFTVSMLLIYAFYFLLESISTMGLICYLLFELPLFLFSINLAYAKRYKEINVILLGIEFLVLFPLIFKGTNSNRLLYSILIFSVMLLGQGIGYRIAKYLNQEKKKNLKKTLWIGTPMLILFLSGILFLLVTNKTFFTTTYTGLNGQTFYVPKYSYFVRESGGVTAILYSRQSETVLEKEIATYLDDFTYIETENGYRYQKGDLTLYTYEVQNHGWYRIIYIGY